MTTIESVSAADVIADAIDQAEAFGRTACIRLGKNLGEVWVMAPARIELTGWGNHVDLPLRYQYTPGFGMGRLVTKEEAISLVEKAR